MGKHRLPSQMLERSGAFDHDPKRRDARQDEPVPTGPLGDAPEYFTPTQRSIWNELAAQVPAGVLTIADRILVEITAKLIARLRDPNDRLKAAETNQIISCLARMGLTPADRSKVGAKTPEREKSDDTFARLASSGRGTQLEQ